MSLKMFVLSALNIFMLVSYATARPDGYVGCFKDNAKVRAMPWNGFVKNVHECLEKCKAKKQLYAGLQNGAGCYCGTYYDKYGGSNGCKKPCKSGEICGGFSINSVYHIHSDHSDNPEYVGCFKDNALFRAMPWNGFTKSVKECVKRCEAKHQLYAGLQFGKGCYCGTNYAKYGRSGGCKNHCKSGGACGGFSINSVYAVHSEHSEHNEHSSHETPAGYVGCFKDNAKVRAMPWNGFTKSVHECLEKCKAKKQPYAGLQFGKGCYCGTNYAKYGISHGCTKHCKSGEPCGAFSINSVYKVDSKSVSPRYPPGYVGCFKDNAKVRAMPWNGFTKSVHECLERCKAKKQPYAGLQFGKGCYCGTNYAKYGRSEGCKNHCKSGEMCGAFSINSVYQVDGHNEASRFQAGHIGCYKDTLKRALHLWKGLVSSVSECIAICAANNQPYAGLQFGKGCRCGSNYNKYGPASGCDKKCKSGEICGAYSKNTVYQVFGNLIYTKIPAGHLGCYGDKKERAMSVDIGPVKSVEECIKHCDDEEESFAAIQNGSHCYCGDNYAKYGRQNNCYKKCESGELCGGHFSNSVYQV